MFGRNWKHVYNKVVDARNAFMRYPNPRRDEKNTKLLNAWSIAIDKAKEYIELDATSGKDSNDTTSLRREFINNEINRYNHQLEKLDGDPLTNVLGAMLNMARI